MNLHEKSVIDNQIMSLLKIDSIGHLIATTPKGQLFMMLNKKGTENDYYFTLDAVHLSEQENKNIMELLK